MNTLIAMVGLPRSVRKVVDELKAAHYCPDWDYDLIRAGDPEMDCCTCDFEESARRIMNAVPQMRKRMP